MSTVGIVGKEPDPRIVYADIIDLPHHQSTTRPHMSLYDRAAQFAPFAALTGYEDMVNEEARVTEQPMALDECATELLNRKLLVIANAIEDQQHPIVRVTCFEPDPYKSGGNYRTTEEEIIRIDIQRRLLILARTEGRTDRNAELPLDSIMELHGKLIDFIDDDIL